MRIRMIAYVIHKVLEPAAFFLVSTAAWEIASRNGLFPPYILPSPSSILQRLIATPDMMLKEAIVTGAEIFFGFAIAIVVGVLLAALIVFVGFVERSLYPWLVVLQVVPKVALGPLLIVWLGFGLGPKVLMAFLLSFFPIMISAMIGLRSAERDSLFLLRSMGATNLKTFLYLQLPTALPGIFSSFKVAITLATVGAIVGEFIGANQGLGYVLVTANGTMDTTLMFVALCWISVLALIFYGAIVLLETRLISWHVSIRTREFLG